MTQDDDPQSRPPGAQPLSRAGKRSQTAIELGTDKLYFKIGEVAEIVAVAPHVLRFWETEFRGVRPQKSRARQRVYRRRDVEMLLKIKHLLYDKRFTIAGAKQQLASGEPTEAASPSPAFRLRNSVAKVRERLDALAGLLRSDEQHDPLCADPAAFARTGEGIGVLVADAGPADDSNDPASRDD